MEFHKEENSFVEPMQHDPAYSRLSENKISSGEYFFFKILFKRTIRKKFYGKR